MEWDGVNLVVWDFRRLTDLQLLPLHSFLCQGVGVFTIHCGGPRGWCFSRAGAKLQHTANRIQQIWGWTTGFQPVVLSKISKSFCIRSKASSSCQDLRLMVFPEGKELTKAGWQHRWWESHGESRCKGLSAWSWPKYWEGLRPGLRHPCCWKWISKDQGFFLLALMWYALSSRSSHL